MNWIVDANVACKWYLDEPGSAAARRLLDGDDVLAAPDIVLAEVVNVAWQRRRRGEIGAPHAAAIARHLPTALVLIPSREILERALDVAVAIDQPVYDCLYVAAAERFEAALVTDDRKLLAAIRKGRLRISTRWLARLGDPGAPT
jgi:predicted nucleic acid-binding protein